MFRKKNCKIIQFWNSYLQWPLYITFQMLIRIKCLCLYSSQQGQVFISMSEPIYICSGKLLSGPVNKVHSYIKHSHSNNLTCLNPTFSLHDTGIYLLESRAFVYIRIWLQLAETMHMHLCWCYVINIAIVKRHNKWTYVEVFSEVWGSSQCGWDGRWTDFALCVEVACCISSTVT